MFKDHKKEKDLFMKLLFTLLAVIFISCQSVPDTYVGTIQDIQVSITGYNGYSFPPFMVIILDNGQKILMRARPNTSTGMRVYIHKEMGTIFYRIH